MIDELVSIIIPAYNASNYLSEAINSALAQTYSNIEIIVINDGSSDNGATRQIALSYGDRIRYFEKENGGVSSALNFGIKKMSGKYFSWLSHDDVYERDKIESQIAAIRKYNLDENTLICCKASFIDKDSKPITVRKIDSGFESYRLYESFEVLERLLAKHIFNGCCLLIPRKILIESGLFDENLRFCQDAFMWYKIFMKRYSLFCIDDISVKSRVHECQLTQTGQNLFRKECNEISNFLADKFANISTSKNNFLKLYLLSDARYLKLHRVKEIVSLGKKKGLLSHTTIVKSYIICVYGMFRPLIRKTYYAIFRNLKTS